MLSLAPRPVKTQNNSLLQAKAVYEEVMTEVFKAEQEGFKDKKILSQAVEKLNRALVYTKTEPLLYIGMAYILILLAEEKQALKYLQQALRLDPYNQMAQQLVQGLSEMQQLRQPKQRSSRGATISAINPVALYDEVKVYIQTQLKRFSELKIQPKPSLDTQFCLQLKTQYREIKETISYVEKHLQLLEEEPGVNDLYRHLAVIEKMAKRYQEALTFSKALVSIQENIRKCSTHVSTCLNLLSQHKNGPVPGFFLERVEKLLDLCDRTADQLDVLDSKGVSIKTLEPEYEGLVAYLGKLQDRIEEY